MLTSSLVALGLLAAGVSAVPVDAERAVTASSAHGLVSRAGTPNSVGTNNGLYYSWWSDVGASANYTNGTAGQYSITWQSGGNLVGGKGWNPGTTTYVYHYSPNAFFFSALRLSAVAERSC